MLDEQNGRFEWLRQDLAQLREEMRSGFADLKTEIRTRDQRLNSHSARLDVLEKESYAGMKTSQKALIFVSPLIAALIGYAVSFLPRG